MTKNTYYQFDKRLLQLEISAQAKILYMLLNDMQRATNANKNIAISMKNCAIVKQETIAIKLKITRRQTIRIINELTQCNLISHERYQNDATIFFINDISDFKKFVKKKQEKAMKKSLNEEFEIVNTSDSDILQDDEVPF